MSTPLRVLSLVLLTALGCAGSVEEADDPSDTAALSTQVSVNGARISPLTRIVDADGATWTVSAGVVYKNGAKAAFSAGVVNLLYFDDVIYQTTAAGWWSWTGTGWSVTPDPRITSKENTDVTSTGYLVDGNKNVWVIKGGVVYKNGAPAGTTAKVTDLVYKAGHVYQKNVYDNYYEWNGATWPACAPPIPPPAAASVAYSLLAFDSPFSDLSGIDLQDSQAKGFDWYPTCFFCKVAPASAFSIVSDGGVKALRIDGSGNNSIYSMLKTKSNGVVGTSFGGGAYFEARIAMAEPQNGASAWPAFWALPNLDDASLSWPGTTSTYDDSVELDFMELMPLSTTSYLSPRPTIGSTLHDWYGVYDTTCAGKHFCQVASSVHLSDTTGVQLESTATAPVYNTFGALWVPSKKLASGAYSQGRIELFFNDEPYGNPITYTGPVPSTPTVPSSKTPWTFAPIDAHEYGLILGTGGNAFMNVQWVHVWQ